MAAASQGGPTSLDGDLSLDSGVSTTHLATDASSLVDLKAEVFRKKQEAQFNRLHGQSNTASSHFLSAFHGTAQATGSTTKRKKTPTVAGNPGVAERAQRDRDHPDANLTSSSQAEAHRERVLAAKAELYDQLQSGETNPKDDRFLVNFTRTPVHPQEDSDEELDSRCSSEKWVEYTDTLGRTRSCLKSQLAELQAQDREWGSAQQSGSATPTVISTSQSKASLAFLGAKAPDLLSEDMRRELLRQKWEKEEEENLQKRNVHYQDVLFDEARTHGAAFYQFSRDEPERAREKEELETRHQETLVAQERKQQVKRQRDALMKDRLKKVRERKRLKMGLPLENGADKDQDEKDRPMELSESYGTKEERPEDVEQSIVQGLIALREKAEADRDAKRKSIVREWDVGKEGVPSLPDYNKMKGEKKILDQKEWIQERRSDRSSEFAPPSLYSNESTKTSRKQHSLKPVTPKPQNVFDQLDTTAPGISDLTPDEWLNIPLPGFQNVQSSKRAVPESQSSFSSERSKSSRSGIEIEPPSSMEYFNHVKSGKSRSRYPPKLDINKAFTLGLSNRVRKGPLNENESSESD
ncbi:coiled-coil domain-containing protein 174-like [Tigriopus californicus]|uniref:coiled-coil domain-containing protein 174-like n=1 Tax=Tigriopus californicus TaxID=6832 RepID=UPI0027DA3BB8|nr:coiled-coil domain-containing protein 174-like [Tigriopus californicus]|eukprot:TCALIF_05442-PA protein Name:"Similar to CCDC174 Coiled-coil domain-containing protein 174 (Gallus gallus)" AED:0.17 eAED:0.19 QI:0/-1/0/1/-1/1/1/0/580